MALNEHQRADLEERIRNDIRGIRSIYRTVGDALYGEPVDRLVARVLASVDAVLGNGFDDSDFKKEPTKRRRKR